MSRIFAAEPAGSHDIKGAAMIDYRSDNTGRAAPQILEALVRANRDTALGYGADEWTARPATALLRIVRD